MQTLFSCPSVHTQSCFQFTCLCFTHILQFSREFNFWYLSPSLDENDDEYHPTKSNSTFYFRKQGKRLLRRCLLISTLSVHSTLESQLGVIVTASG